MTCPTSRSGLGAEEPLSTATGDTGSPPSTGYHTRSSSSEEVATEPGASLRGSRELPAGAVTRTRTASELLHRSGVAGVRGGALRPRSQAWG